MSLGLKIVAKPLTLNEQHAAPASVQNDDGACCNPAYAGDGNTAWRLLGALRTPSAALPAPYQLEIGALCVQGRVERPWLDVR